MKRIPGMFQPRLRLLSVSMWTVSVVMLATFVISVSLHGDAYCDDDAGNLCGLQPALTGLAVAIPAFLALAIAFDLLVTGEAWHVVVLIAISLTGQVLAAPLPVPIAVGLSSIAGIAWLLPIPGIPITLLLSRRRVQGPAGAAPNDTVPDNPLARQAHGAHSAPQGITTQLAVIAALTTGILSLLLMAIIILLTQPN